MGVVDQGGSPSFATWIVSGGHLRYSNGKTKQALLPFFIDSAQSLFAYDYSYDGSYPSHVMTYDGAGRTLTDTDADGFQTSYSYQFGLATAASSVVAIDPEQASGSHTGSFTTSYTDGHGRVVKTDRRVARSQLGAGDLVMTTAYTAAGEKTSITQSYPGGTYQRQMTWDTLGRMVAQTEPNTGTWQYAYNDSGDLVGRMDARGCGEVIYHDGLGRVTAEDYSPCASSDSPEYSAPNLTTGDGTESFSVYDGYGNVAREADRAQTSTYAYDPRNRLTKVERQVAVPGGSPTLAARYAPQVYTRKVSSYSEANRPLVSTTGTDLPTLKVAGLSEVTTAYAMNGPVISVGSSYGSLLLNQETDASGRVVFQLFGDAARTGGSRFYDGNGWLQGYTMHRSPGPWVQAYARGGDPGATDFTVESQLADATLTYDMVGNPVSITESGLVTAEWAPGALPTVSRSMTYWDDYRLATTSAAYDGPGGDDAAGLSGNPYTPAELSAASYPAPAPVSTGHRVRSQTFGYDLHGNVLTSADDADDLWDRSLGAVTYAPGTDQLTTTTGSGSALYDASGDIVAVTTATGVTFEFSFDEVGRLARAVRQDPAGTMVTESFAYDAHGERVVSDKSVPGAADVYLVNVFDSLVLKDASFPDTNGDYEHDDATEQLYLNSGGTTFGRAFYSTTLPSATLSNVHVYIPVSDPLGSTSFVIDQGTSELVEATTYQPYGGVESDYRPTRWQEPREDVRYTGQWDNAEVGLVYMHARYYLPELGRFVSPDPLAVQGAKGDLNPYAYAGGSPFRYTDPTGLLGEGSTPNGDADDPTCNSVVCGATGTLQLPEITIQGEADQKPLPFAPPSVNFDSLSAGHSDNPWEYSGDADTTISWLETPRQLQADQERFVAMFGGAALGAFGPAESSVPTQFARGSQFETQGLDVIGGAKNTQGFTVPINGQAVTTIPDAVESDMLGPGFTEFKDRATINMTPQLRAQQLAASQLNLPWNIVVSPNNQTISGPVWNNVLSTGGNIYLLDPTAITIQGD